MNGPGNDCMLVAAVGHNPASAVIAARAAQASSVLLLHTPETIDIARVIRSQLHGTNVSVTLLACDTAWGIERMAKTVRGALPTTQHLTLLADVTGGTKLMGLAIWEALGQARGESFKALYLDQSTMSLVDARCGTPLDTRVDVAISEILEWYGGSPAKQPAWVGSLRKIPDSYRRRAGVGKALFLSVGRGCQDSTPPYADVAASRLKLPDPLPREFSLHGKRLSCSEPGYLQLNGWLEELCLVWCAEACVAHPDIRAAHSVHVRAGKSGGVDEMDVVLARGAHAVVIEAKARGSASGAGHPSSTVFRVSH